MDTTQHVAIPSKFFLEEARHEYSDYQTRLIQELLQNSLDAGASRIDLTVTDTGYICADNGRGMAKDRMVSALLTMGGSAKEASATGGFGAAKKLLLFAHKSFFIHSNDTSVDGTGLSYHFVNRGSRTGTEVGADFADGFDGSPMLSKTNSLLGKCNFRGRCRIYVNGELFTNYSIFPHLMNIEGIGYVFGNKRRTTICDYVHVLHNGLYMFSRYVGELNRNVQVEVVGKSIDMFTQNRDGFRYPASTAFDQFITNLTIDKESFVKAKVRKFVVEGENSFISHISEKFTMSPAVQKMLDMVQVFSPAAANNPVAFADALNTILVTKTENASAGDLAVAREIIAYVQSDDLDFKVETDFHIDLADSSFRKVPDKFIPNSGKLKYTMLAKLWKVCVREVLKANGLDQNFVIGFTFDENAVATHQKKSGVSCYLVNPQSKEVDKGTKQERVMKVLTTAVHEVVHSQGKGGHDESFVLEFHRLLVPTLTKGPTWRQLVKLAKTEKV